MTAQPNAVTDYAFPKDGKFLPLHHRTVVKTVWFFYCSKCHKEHRFSWFDMFCTETGDLLCYFCTPARNWDKDRTGWKICRRCRQPRRVGKDTQFTWLAPYTPPAYVCYPDHNTVCDECRRVVSKQREPLQMVCAHCGEAFTAKRSDARFCSGRCSTAAHRAVTAQDKVSEIASRHSDGAPRGWRDA